MVTIAQNGPFCAIVSGPATCVFVTLDRGSVMPVVVDPAALADYAAFPTELDRDWLGRVCHLGAAELEQARRRSEDPTRLGYALQLVTVRAIGTFLPDPTTVPAPVVVALARQLDIADPGVTGGYRELAVRWRHTAEIRERYGYRDFTAHPGHFLFTRWLYRQAWADEVSPSVLFRAAHRHLLGEQILLPGQSVLARLVAAVRDRAARRLHTRLVAAAPFELVARLEKLLLVPKARGARTWTGCAAHRSPRRSPGWSEPCNAVRKCADWAPARWICPGCQRGG
jgi:hypothetical protein